MGTKKVTKTATVTKPVKITKKSSTKILPSLPRTFIKRVTKLGEPWQLDEKQHKLSGSFSFPTYLEAFMFVSRVSVHIEVHKHYPTITIQETQVTFTFIASISDTVSDLDIDLAERINLLSTRAATRR